VSIGRREAGRTAALRKLRRMDTREMLRQSWRAWINRSAPRVGPWWIDHVWTVVFSLVVALGFSVLFADGRGRHSVGSWSAWYLANAMVSLTIGFSIRSAFWLAERLVGRARLLRLAPWQRSLYFTVVPLMGVAIGWPLGMWWGFDVDARAFFPLDRPELLWSTVLIMLLISAMFQVFFRSASLKIQAENRATEAQLRLLQAQIEPHFLFNTLANVVSLMEVDAPRAKTMLEAFVDYLRASLSGLGPGQHTLGDEIDLVDAYMKIIKIRMEDRLDYAIDVPAALRALALPPLTLQPLVENAIVHGLEPQIDGGRVRIGARHVDGRLVITVDDDGAGFAATTTATATTTRGGAGTALGNIRQRLAQTYGSGARLELEPALPRGVRARLSLPIAR
jgi:signal transduction histidine kinase